MRHARPGYTMLETVAALSLVTLFLILAGQLTTRVVVIQRDAVDMEWSISNMEFALRQLRQDVWTASTGSVSSAELNEIGLDRLELGFEDGERIAWWFEADPSSRFPGRGWMHRAVLAGEDAGEPAMRYEVPHAITPASTLTGGGLQVEVDDRVLWLPSQVRLTSDQVAVLPGGRP